MLDIMNNKHIDSKLKHDEIIFFGPDENTADKMDYACKWAERNGYK